jgi:hypothetical protein
MTERELIFAEEFEAPELDRSVWLPHYLPAWSSLAASAATYEIRDSCLRLAIPHQQGLWCAGDHLPALRVSAIQSGNFSGPVGSTIGQHPFRPGLVVREQQQTFWGWTPGPSYIELRARMAVSERSLAAFWMIGLEDTPDHSAEICVMEVFGKDVVAGVSAAVGMGVRALRDPTAIGDFAAPRVNIDVREFHQYAVDWTADRAAFLIDGQLVRTCTRPPVYPMQVMLTVYDFPDASSSSAEVPELVVDYLRACR